MVSFGDYFSYKKPPEQIEFIDGKFDFVSYNIDKAFTLIEKSNPCVLEWLRGDMIYYNKFPKFKQFVNQVEDNISLKTLFLHYKNLSKNNYQKFIANEKRFTYKITVYVLRGLLSCLFIMQCNKAPPLNFQGLVNEISLESKKKDIILEILNKKKGYVEEANVENKTEIKNLIIDLSYEVNGASINKNGDRDKLKEILNGFSKQIKSGYYLTSSEKSSTLRGSLPPC